MLGLGGTAGRAFAGEAGDSAGYMHRLLVVQNHTALSASCLLFKRSLHDELGGFDENDFAHGHADVDFSLRARQLGYLSVWTPYAILAQNGNVELPSVEADESLYRRWLPALARDPAYNRNLSLEGPGSPWSAPRYRPGNRCSDGRRCRGSWRILPIPTVVATIACVSRSARCTTPACWTACSASRSCSRWRWAPGGRQRDSPAADQRRAVAGHFRMRSFNRAFRVYELDDYLPELPLKSLHRAEMPGDIRQILGRALGLADRFVVSTEPLAEAFRRMHGDIRVVPNRLPLPWWRDLSSRRRDAERPRVGWAGGIGHGGDLEAIAEVVRELADEVDWVFFGFCPDALRPYVREYHPGWRSNAIPPTWPASTSISPWRRWSRTASTSARATCASWVRRARLPGDLQRRALLSRQSPGHAGEEPFQGLAGGDPRAPGRCRRQRRGRRAVARAVRRDWMLEGAHLEAWAAAWLPD